MFMTTFAWTPLVTTETFAGVQADVLTTVMAVVGIFMVIAGVGFILRAVGR